MQRPFIARARPAYATQGALYMQTQADMGIGPVSYENRSVFKKGEGGPEAPGALRLRNKKATASVASSYSQNTPEPGKKHSKSGRRPITLPQV